MNGSTSRSSRDPDGINAAADRPSLSFILPALNEETHIGGVIDSIKAAVPDGYAFEIIVADNGSTDRTVERAEAGGAQVVTLPGRSVGALRNGGAAVAEGDVLVFLDSDVYLTAAWRKRIGPVLEMLAGPACLITGSTCGISARPSWLEQCWWGQQKPKTSVNYINSGHLIVSRQAFATLGGFSETLTTGEDAEFCQRPRNVPVTIRHDDQLAVIHEGYPKTLAAFFKRERWHGIGDYQSPAIFFRSKPALLALFQAAAFLCLTTLSLITHSLFYLTAYIAFMTLICLTLAYRRSPSLNRCLLINSLLFFVYLWARALSLIEAWTDNKRRSHR
ncbi:glycosyltransferase [bacterium]|nr:glycosyltransferase [bacterium]